MKKTSIPAQGKPSVNLMSAAALRRVAVYARVGTDEQAVLAARIAQAHDYAKYFQSALRGYQMKGGAAQ